NIETAPIKRSLVFECLMVPAIRLRCYPRNIEEYAKWVRWKIWQECQLMVHFRNGPSVLIRSGRSVTTCDKHGTTHSPVTLMPLQETPPKPVGGLLSWTWVAAGEPLLHTCLLSPIFIL